MDGDLHLSAAAFFSKMSTNVAPLLLADVTIQTSVFLSVFVALALLPTFYIVVLSASLPPYTPTLPFFPFIFQPVICAIPNYGS